MEEEEFVEVVDGSCSSVVEEGDASVLKEKTMDDVERRMCVLN